MAAGFDDTSVIQHDDSVGMCDRTQTVSDYETGPISDQPFQTELDQAFTLGVQVAGCLVENQDSRVCQDRPGDRKALPLTTTETHATFADDGLQTSRQPVDEFRGIGDVRSIANFFIRAFPWRNRYSRESFRRIERRPVRRFPAEPLNFRHRSPAGHAHRAGSDPKWDRRNARSDCRS